MSDINALFRKRISISESEIITFRKLDTILEGTAKNIPFENLCIIKNQTSEISQENLIHKILVKKEGGLCYELNSMFYLFLIENNFDAVLTRGVVYDHTAQDYLRMGRTHVTIIVTHKKQKYLLDTGFGGNLPLKPVPVSGETVTSNNGQFRIKKKNNEFGDYVLEQKLKHKDKDWKIGYTFDSQKTINDISELNEIQTIIAEHPDSTFNKNPLITKLTDRGNITLTDVSFTQWVDGRVTKEKIDNLKFNVLLKQYFGLSNT